jgi:hypothetical protein
MNATKADYGVYGPSTGRFAVFQAGSIVSGAANQGYEVTYGGNLAVVTDSHFANGYSGAYPYIDIKDEAMIYAPGFEDGLPAFSIKGTGCNPGFTGGGSDASLPIDPYVTSYKKKVTTVSHGKTTKLIKQGRVMCEDLGQVSSNDLDFNDVVFDAYVYKIDYWKKTSVTVDGITLDGYPIKEAEEGKAPEYKTDIVLLAAGGTLSLSVAGNHEVHNEFDAQPISVIVNTVEAGDNSWGNPPYETSAKYLGRFDYQNIADIPIDVVYPNGEAFKLKAPKGAAPHKICVPITTRWTKERMKMREAYQVFPEWVENESFKFWDNPETIDESKLYKNLEYTIPNPMRLGDETISTEKPVEEYVDGTSSGGIQSGDEVLSRRKNLK